MHGTHKTVDGGLDNQYVSVRGVAFARRMRACLRGKSVVVLTCVCLCFCYISFRERLFLLSSRRFGWLSRQFPESCRKDSPSRSAKGGGGATHDIIHTRPLSLWPCCCVCCCVLFLFLLSPIGKGLCLYECMCVFLWISVCLCFVSLESFFHTCYGSPPKLCNLEAPPPTHTHTHTAPCLHLPLFQTTLAPTDRALFVHWHGFCLQGLPTQPQDHLE